MTQGQNPTEQSVLPFHCITCMVKLCELSICMHFQTFWTSFISETVLNCGYVQFLVEILFWNEHIVVRMKLTILYYSYEFILHGGGLGDRPMSH